MSSIIRSSIAPSIIIGGDSSSDPTISSYTTMTTLDAGLTTVGGIARLVGATTGGVIATVMRISAGVRGLIWLRALDLSQADGTELDGSFAPVSLGAAAAVTWGGVGSRGMILPAGTINLPGWAYVSGRRAIICARILGWVTPGSPLQHDCLAAGFIRDTSGVVAYGGGIGYSSPSARRSALMSAGTLDLPAGAYGAAIESGPLADGAVIDCAVSSEQANATTAGRYHAGYSSSGVNSGGLSSSSTIFQADITDFQPAFIRRGDWGSARVTLVVVDRAL
jgi:hypothetical protein